MTISTLLKKFSELLPVPIYVVGGAVRNHFANFKGGDVDLASELTPSELKKYLKNSEFKVIPVNPKIGTVVLVLGDERYEHTTFRIDSYAVDGTHNPFDVKLTKDINIDAMRRDFTINAIYYDVKNQTYKDPTNGILHLQNKLIKTVKKPIDTFSEDALRLLRLVRIAAQTGFEIDDETLKGATEAAELIKSISRERIRDEFDLMLIADMAYEVKSAHYRAFKIADEIGILKYILPNLVLGKNLNQPKLYHKYDVFEHMLRTMEAAPVEIRLVALMHDIGKPIIFLKTGRYTAHAAEGAKLCRTILNELRYPKSLISKVCKLVEIHMFDLLEDANEEELMLFVQSNFAFMNDLIKLIIADEIGSGSIRSFERRITRLRTAKKILEDNKLPLAVSELKVTGLDLIEKGVEECKRTVVLKEILRRSVLRKAPTRDEQFQILVEVIEEFR